MSDPPKKKNKFNVTLAQRPLARPRAPASTPRVRDLSLATASPVKPPEAVRAKIGEPDWQLMAGFDVETHGWEDVESIGGTGQCGFFCICPPAKLQARAVQLGWIISSKSSVLIHKERMIKPVGFQIEQKAIDFHGISHTEAASHGFPLEEVLKEFLADLFEARSRGARIISHHLEFDAGILANELDHAGMSEQRSDWLDFVREGFCTMDPDVGRWVRECCAMETAFESNRNIMTLPALASALRPYGQWPDWTPHRAGSDARMHLAVYDALVELWKQAEAK